MPYTFGHDAFTEIPHGGMSVGHGATTVSMSASSSAASGGDAADNAASVSAYVH